MTTEPVTDDALSPVLTEPSTDDVTGQFQRDVLLRCLADLG